MSTSIEAARGDQPAPARPGRGHAVRSQLALVVGLIIAGALLAVLWRTLTPHTVHLGDEQEAAAAVDGTLALLGLPFGALTALAVLLRPGRSPVARTLAAIIGSLLGALVSWVLGDQLGTPALRAVGSAFTWPVATSVVLFFGALLPWTSNRLQPPPGPDPGR